MNTIKIKSFIKMLPLLCLLGLSSVTVAQDNDYTLIESSLTKAQKELLQKERKMMIANREALHRVSIPFLYRFSVHPKSASA